MFITNAYHFTLKSIVYCVFQALRSSVHVVVSRTSAERIQIVIEDADGSDRTGELADIIQDKVSKGRCKAIHNM